MQSKLGPLWNVFQHRYYIDSFYMRAIVLPTRDKLSAGVYWFNQHVLDAVVNGAAGLARAVVQGDRVGRPHHHRRLRQRHRRCRRAMPAAS